MRQGDGLPVFCVIVVTHDPEAAEAADMILRMKDGALTAARDE